MSTGDRAWGWVGLVTLLQLCADCLKTLRALGCTGITLACMHTYLRPSPFCDIARSILVLVYRRIEIAPSRVSAADATD